jgi:hypothetical protein
MRNRETTSVVEASLVTGNSPWEFAIEQGFPVLNLVKWGRISGISGVCRHKCEVKIYGVAGLVITLWYHCDG